MTKGELAKSYFLEGYNCSQSIVLAFKDEIGLDQSSLLKLVSPLGGGMGRLREVCGSVSGMFIVLGYLYGYDDPKDTDTKAELYSRVQELAKKFEDDNGSIVCRELLNLRVKHSTSTPDIRDNNYYTSRPCPELIKYAGDLLQNYIENHPYK